MNKKIVKIIAIVIAILFMLGILGPLAYMFVFSEPQNGESMNSVSNADVREIERQIGVLNTMIADSENQLQKINVRLEAAEALEREKMAENGEHFRIMCERGMMSCLDIIFSAKNFNDLTDRAVIAGELAEYDKSVMDSLKKIKEGIYADKAEAERIQQECESAKSELLRAKEELNSI